MQGHITEDAMLRSPKHVVHDSRGLGAYIEDVLGQRAGEPLLVEGIEVGGRRIGNGSADVDLHDEVAVAEVGRLAGGESCVGFVDEVQGPARIR